MTDQASVQLVRCQGCGQIWPADRDNADTWQCAVCAQRVRVLYAYFCSSRECEMDREYMDAVCRRDWILLVTRDFATLSNLHAHHLDLLHEESRKAGVKLFDGQAPAYVADGFDARVPRAFGVLGICRFERALRDPPASCRDGDG